MSADYPTTPQRLVLHGVALETDRHAAGTGVTFCFSERTGGVSPEPWASLNLGGHTEDDPANVARNRQILLEALGAPQLAEGLVVPRQVHGDTVAVISDARAPLPPEVSSGCDGIVCTAPGVATLLAFADCVPVVLVAPGGYAVIHSGWRGTVARIAGKGARMLAQAAGCGIGQVSAYIGPHIGAEAYEVSADLADRFAAEFGPAAVPMARHLDLGRAVALALTEAGVDPDRVVSCGQSTYENVDRFFSHRAENGRTGRHGALAFMLESAKGVEHGSA